MQTTEQKQIAGEGEREMSTRKKGEEERPERTLAFLCFIAHWPHKPQLFFYHFQ